MAEEWEWIGWLGIPAHPDSPSGGPGPGFFRPAGPRPPSTGGLPDPHSPAARGLSGSDVEHMLNQHRAEAAIGRAHRAADLHSLRFAANAVLGHYSFGAGVSYGLVKSPTVAIADLLELGRVFVLADFYDRIYGSQRWRFTFGPAVFAETGLRLMLATGLMSRSIVERAHQERQAILAELEHIISNPLEFLSSIPETVAKQYAARWREYQLHAASSNLEDQFKAGTILGELLFEVLSLVAGVGSGVAAAAKLAARAPQLARFSRAVLGSKGGGGAAGEGAAAATSRPSRSAAGVAKTPSQLAAEARAAPSPVRRPASPVPSSTATSSSTPGPAPRPAAAKPTPGGGEPVPKSGEPTVARPEEPAKPARKPEKSRAERTEELAKDPDRNNGVPDATTRREAEVVVDLEDAGRLQGPLRRPNATDKIKGDVVDGNGTHWDVKSPRSRDAIIRDIQQQAAANGKTAPNLNPNNKIAGEFDAAKTAEKIGEEFRAGENVIVDTAKMEPAQVNALKTEIAQRGLDPSRILFYP